MANRELRQIGIDKILESGRPLLIARAALDEVYEQEGSVAFELAKNDCIPEEVFQPLKFDSAETYARDILGRKFGTDDWVDWFNLKATLDLRELQTYFGAAFKRRISYANYRASMLRGGQIALGNLLMQAFDEYERTDRSRIAKKSQLRGMIGEFAVLSLLNDPADAESGARKSVTYDDYWSPHKIRYRRISRGDSFESKVQIATIMPVNAEEKLLSSRINTVVADDFLSLGKDWRFGVKLILLKHFGRISPEEEASLTAITSNLRDYIEQGVPIR